MFSIQDIENLCRSDLQSLAKKHGIKANGKTTVIRAELIKKLVSRDDKERFEECSINNQGLEEVSHESKKEISSESASEEAIDTVEVEEVGPVEVQEVVEENAADKEVPDSISKDFNISKGNDPADEKAESEKSTVQHMTKTSIKKKRLSTGKKSKLEKISEKSPKSDAPIPPCESLEPSIMPPAPLSQQQLPRWCLMPRPDQD